MKKSIILLITITSLITACSNGSIRVEADKVVLSTKDIAPLKSLEKSIGFTKAHGRINIFEFKDVRVNKSNIGEAVVGATNKTLPIQMDISVSDYVKNRLISGFSKRGMDVVSKSSYAVSGKITKFKLSENADGYTPESANCEIDLDFYIMTTSGRNIFYKGNVTSRGMGTNSFMDATDSLGPVMESCMELIIEKLINNEDARAFFEIRSSQ